MYTCAQCGILACLKEEGGNQPKNCPMNENALMGECLERYHEPGNDEFFKVAAAVEGNGFGRWPRLREVGEFCRRMKYRRVGVAFCMGLRREAEVVVKTLKPFGFEIESIGCKAGGAEKSAMGIEQCHYVRPGAYEIICNPIAQAEFLNQAQTDFNVVVGLCVGHDSLFFKYSAAPVTTLIAKDRALANNPAGAIYCAEGYMRNTLRPSEE